MKQNVRQLLVVVVAVLAFSGRLTAAEKPNILFIFADDQCFQTQGHLGLNKIATPHLDQLAKDGLNFSRAYNMGSWSGAVCVASRTMLNTGRFIWSANSIYKDTEKERQAGRFWSEYLKQAGYDTYMTGKWHVRADAKKAFDFATNVRGGMPNQTPQGYNRPLPNEPDPWDPADPKFEGFWRGGKHWSEVVADDAVGFLKQASQDEDPFFMYIAFNAPHDPRQAPQSYIDRYPADKMRLPVNFLSEYPFKVEMGCPPSLRDERLAPFPRTPEAVRVHRQEYYAIITHMDDQIGRVLQALKDSGKSETTYIFFTADHGLAVGQHGLFGKQNMYDHSVRVPFLVVGPGVAAGESREQEIYLQDIMPTTLQLAGIDQPDHVEFKSLMPLLEGSDEKPYDAIYGAYLQKQRKITFDGYKLIMYPEAQAIRLYHVQDDPDETVDLAEQPEQLPRMKRMFERFLRLQDEMDDDLDVKSVFPQLQDA